MAVGLYSMSIYSRIFITGNTYLLPLQAEEAAAEGEVVLACSSVRPDVRLSSRDVAQCVVRFGWS